MSVIHKGPRSVIPLFNSKSTINPVVIEEKDLGLSVPRKWCRGVPESFFVESNNVFGLYDEKNSKLIRIPNEISEFNRHDLTFNIPKVREYLEPLGVIRESTYKKNTSPRIVTRVADTYSFFARPGKRGIEIGILIDPEERKGIPRNLVSNDKDWVGYKEGMLVIKMPYSFYDFLDIYIEDSQDLISNFLGKYKIT